MLVRPFCSATDFSLCQQLVPNEWTFPDCTDEELTKHRQLVTANMLAISNYGLVAEDPDSHELLGLLLARFADAPITPENVAFSRARINESYALLEHGSVGARRAADMEHSVPHVHEVLDAAAADKLAEHNELTLFIVAEHARGRGVGTSLRTEFERELKARGMHSYYLMTDAVCTYDYYERNGFERLATFTPNADGTGYPNVAYYYQRFLEA